LSVHLSLMLSPARDRASFLLRAGSPVPPDEVVAALNRRFVVNAPERYFTLFYGVLHCDNGGFRYTRARPPRPVPPPAAPGRAPRWPDWAGRTLSPSGLPVGGVEPPFTQQILHLKRGDRLYLYSDGVTEAADADGQMYGQERLLETILRHRASPLDESLAS